MAKRSFSFVDCPCGLSCASLRYACRYSMEELSAMEAMAPFPLSTLMAVAQERSLKSSASLSAAVETLSKIPTLIREDRRNEGTSGGLESEHQQEIAHKEEPQKQQQDGQASTMEHHSIHKRWWREIDPNTQDMACMAVTLSRRDGMGKKICPPRDWHSIMFGFRCAKVALRPDRSPDGDRALRCTGAKEQYVLSVQDGQTTDDLCVWDVASLWEDARLEAGDFIVFRKVDARELTLGAPPTVRMSVIPRCENCAAEYVMAEEYLAAVLTAGGDSDGTRDGSEERGGSGGSGTSMRRRNSGGRRRGNPYGEDFVGGEIYDESYYSMRYVKNDEDDCSDVDDVLGGRGKKRRKRTKCTSKKKASDVVPQSAKGMTRVHSHGSGGAGEHPPKLSLGIARVRVSGQRAPQSVLDTLRVLNPAQFETLLTNFYVGLRGGFKVPNFGGQKLDLRCIFWAVIDRGGYEAVTFSKQWRAVCRCTGVALSGLTSASNGMRINYERCLLEFENYICSGQYTVDEAAGRGPSFTHLMDPLTTRYYIPPPPQPMTITDVHQQYQHLQGHSATQGSQFSAFMPSLHASSVVGAEAQTQICLQAFSAPREDKCIEQHSQHASEAFIGDLRAKSDPQKSESKVDAPGRNAGECDSAMAKGTSEQLMRKNVEVGELSLTDRVLGSLRKSSSAECNVLRRPQDARREDSLKDVSATSSGAASDLACAGKSSTTGGGSMHGDSHWESHENKALKLQKVKNALEDAEKELLRARMPWIRLEEARKAVESNAAWMAELESGLEEVRTYHATLLERQEKAEQALSNATEPDTVLIQRVSDLQAEVLAIEKERASCTIR